MTPDIPAAIQAIDSTVSGPPPLPAANAASEGVQKELSLLNEALEARLARSTEELAKANHELEAFAHSVSHDLRAPLRAISGFGQILSEEFSSKLDERGRGYLGRMMAAAAQMNQLIDGLLQFSRASSLELRRRPLDLGAMALEIVRELHPAGPSRPVDFICAPGLHAEGDPRLIRVLLTNLLDNAWKFTGKTLEPRVELGLSEVDGDNSFFIRDNGAGFDPRYADRLFGVFQRLHSAAEFDGTGIGLATAQRIVHRHGGKIRGESRPDEGATFHFTLPPGGTT